MGFLDKFPIRRLSTTTTRPNRSHKRTPTTNTNTVASTAAAAATATTSAPPPPPDNSDPKMNTRSGPSSQSLSAQCEDILAAIKRYESSSSQKIQETQTDHRAERLRLVQSLDKLASRLKDPKEAIFDHFTNFVQVCNLRGLLELRVPENIPRNGKITAKELGEKVGADESLIARLMRILTVKGLFDMVGPDEYAHTPFSLAYLDGHEVDFFKLMCDEIYTNTSRLAEYFREIGGKDATSMTHNPFTWGNGKPGETFFSIISQDERRIKQFDIAMSTQDFVLPVLGMYPFGTELAGLSSSSSSTSPSSGKEGSGEDGRHADAGADSTRALIVDIGGGRGQSLMQIKREWPDLKGRMILQDRPIVLDSVPDEQIPGIEKMGHDFFTEQPVKHAHAYYIRRCFHNWTDAHCLKILQQIVPAMAPDSRVLIGEMVVPEYGSERPGGVEDMAPYWMDHAMFAFGGRERTETDWRRMFEEAGLRLVKVWRSKAGSQAVMEGRLQ